jgi:acetoin utilization deacetylase AcuC-like enzyme/formylglycine-generating enzyme required for sulfatase activity
VIRLLPFALLGLAACGEEPDPPAAPVQFPIVKTAAGDEMVLIPGGSFEMGSARGRADEGPVHRVTVDAFLMDRSEVTQAMYDRIREPNPSRFKSPSNPVEMIPWTKAAVYCNLRSKAEGLKPCYNEDTAECDFEVDGYRLPTEAEWEYACRAGTTTDYSFGNDPKKLSQYGWSSENAGKKTHPVAQKKPNPWGLYDLHGNVGEWCNDVFAKDAYAKSAEKNPRGPSDGERYVVRGGGWSSGAANHASYSRSSESAGFSDACLAPDAIGFRCVRKAPPAAAQGKKPPTGLVYGPIYLDHDTGQGFPERPARLEAIVNRLKEKELLSKLALIDPAPAPLEWIEEMHSKAYVERVRKACEAAGDKVVNFEGIGDVPICRKSYDVALHAVGGILKACDAVMEGKIRNAYCAIRPPGHHALREKAMGFCLFNNVAIAARYLQKKHGIGKVLIVDWDVHHGNGTQDLFYEDGTVMYFSTHLSPFYPGTGAEVEKGKGKGEGLMINVPLPRGAGDAEVKKAYEEKLKPAALAFKPDFVLVSCGFDSHVNDTLGRLAITSEGFGWMTRFLREIAETTAKGRLVSMMEGGYNLDNLASAGESHVRALMDE